MYKFEINHCLHCGATYLISECLNFIYLGILVCFVITVVFQLLNIEKGFIRSDPVLAASSSPLQFI